MKKQKEEEMMMMNRKNIDLKGHDSSFPNIVPQLSHLNLHP
jgi:hypothetical protein